MTYLDGGKPEPSGPGPGDPEPMDITPGLTADDLAGGDWADDGERATVRLSPRRTTRTRRIVLGSTLALGLAGAAVLGTAGARILQQKDATLTPPPSVAGFVRDEGDSATETAEYLRTALAAGVDLDKTTAVVYADPADDARNVLFFGGTALIFSPEEKLDEALALLSERDDAAATPREVPAGKLGGVMKCGGVTVPEGTMSVCGWADHGSIGVAMFQQRPVAEAEPLTRQIREAAQTRS